MTRIALAITIAISALGCMYSCSAGSHVEDKGILDGCDIIASRDIINNDTVISCHLDRIDTDKTIRLPLSSLVDSLEVIMLEDKEEAMCGMGPVWVSDNYILTSAGMRNGASLLFRRDGSFVGKLGDLGNGPGEYRFSIFQRQIDEDAGRIYLYSFTDPYILMFDLRCNFLGEIPLAHHPKSERVEFFADYDKNETDVFLFICPEETDTLITTFRQTLDGTIIDEHCHAGLSDKTKEHGFDYGSINTILKNRESILFTPHHDKTPNDTIFQYDRRNCKLTPRFTVAGASEDTNVQLTYMSGLYFAIAYDASGVRTIVTDPRTLKGSVCEIYNDMLGGIDLSEGCAGQLCNALYNNNYGFAWMYDSGDFTDAIGARLAEDITEDERERLNALLADIPAEGNNIVVLGRPKQQ